MKAGGECDLQSTAIKEQKAKKWLKQLSLLKKESFSLIAKSIKHFPKKNSTNDTSKNFR
jgi:2'-5' RNA ligase